MTLRFGLSTDQRQESQKVASVPRVTISGIFSDVTQNWLEPIPPGKMGQHS